VYSDTIVYQDAVLKNMPQRSHLFFWLSRG